MTGAKEIDMTVRRQNRIPRGVLRAAAAGIVAVVAFAAAVATAEAAPTLAVTTSHSPSSVPRGDEYLSYTVQVRNTGDITTSGNLAVSFDLAAGLELDIASGTGWTCYVSARTCFNAATVIPGADAPALTLGITVDPIVAPDVTVSTFTAVGGGADGAAIARDSLALAPPLTFGLTSFTATANDQSGADHTQAGGHPFSANTTFAFQTKRVKGGGSLPFESVRDAVVNLPPGFVANPNAVNGEGCTIQQVLNGLCPERFAVGRVYATLTGVTVDQRSPVYKVQREPGYPAEFAFKPAGAGTVVVVLRPKVRPGDFGVTAFSPAVPQTPELFRVDYFTFCSYGVETTPAFFQPEATHCKTPTDSGALARPFLTNMTRCDGVPPVTTIDVASYEHPGDKDADGLPVLSDTDWKTRSSTAPEVTGCDQVPFDPSVTVALTSSAPDSASGLDFDLEVPQDGLLDGESIATSHLRRTVVKLPDGLTVNPSGATGLEGCTDEQAAVEVAGPAQCPEASKIGMVEVTSPLISKTLAGGLYLGTPKSTDPASGQMLRLFLIVDDEDMGVRVKLAGRSVADPATGRLTATFDDNPQLPFGHLSVRLKGGARGVLATPWDCGTKTTATTLTPWSGNEPVQRASDTDIVGDCGERFVPALAAGSSDSRGRGQGGTYGFKFNRGDGEQWLRGLTAKLPQGLLASVRDVPLCSNVAADAGNCPASSKIGIVDAKAGAGDPLVLEQKGEVFLTEGYKGGEYGLAVKIRPVAGPFRGAMELSPIVVRQAIHVDRTTARVTAISDPFPLIHHGIPLRAREVAVLVNRDGFMVNPSDCDPKQSEASLLSAEGATANLSDRFQVSGCAGLAFKPKLALRLTGRGQVATGRHPGINATVTQQGISEAGIEKAVVRLPKSLALDPDNAQTLCEFADGTKSDLENHCPKGSIVGRARARTPLLNRDLVGNVYFVKNVRIDPRTGNQLRTLPMIIVALRGEIAINLKGESSTTKGGKLVNTFANVPDAPITQFNLNIQGGRNGIIAVTRTRKAKINLCAGRHTAETDMDAQNGRRHDTDVRMKTPCTKKQSKRAAKRAAGRR